MSEAKETPFPLKPGEILVVRGENPTLLTAWCQKQAEKEDNPDAVSFLSFAHHVHEARKTGWPQARYYDDSGLTVSDLLSYDTVWEINPFEVGAHRPESRKGYRRRMADLLKLFDVESLLNNPLISLSNGETRRILIVRAMARKPRLLILDDPYAGLDRQQSRLLRSLISAMAKSGMAIIVSYRHQDEIPEGVTQRWRINGRGRLKRDERQALLPRKGEGKGEKTKKFLTVSNIPPSSVESQENRIPVVEIKDLSLSLGRRTLFRDFSWTIRRGEKWLLKGRNGSGKTTLMDLIAGDHPYAYASDLKVFGIPRSCGTSLVNIRRRIGRTSPEMQAFLGKRGIDLIEEALSRNPELLILDEPFMNMDGKETKKATARINRYLMKNPRTATILISHRDDEIPVDFDKEMNLDEATGQSGKLLQRNLDRKKTREARKRMNEDSGRYTFAIIGK